MGEAIDTRQIEQARSVIAHARERYEKDRNPLYVWQAYLETRRAGLDLADWILEYLDSVSLEIWSLAQQVGHGQQPSDVWGAVAEALKLKQPGRTGRGTVFTDMFDKNWIFLGCMVAFYMEQGDQETYAIEDVAKKNGVSRSTAHRAWKRYQQECPDNPALALLAPLRVPPFIK